MAIGDKKSAVMQSDIVNDFTTGGSTNVLSAEMGKTLAQRPNPNLLENWYFANPVNQRGKTIYSGLEANPYTIDRWRAAQTNANTATIEITNNGINIKLGTNNGLEFSQRFEPERLPIIGKVVTLSVCVDGIVYSVTNVVPFTKRIAVAGKTVEFSVMQVTDNDTTYMRVYILPLYADLLNLHAIKLELGSQQTLAHQDADGNWILNEIPGYGEQLVRCQRYYYKDVLGYLGMDATGVYGNQNRAIIHFPQTMRATPSVSVTPSSGYTAPNALALSPNEVLLYTNSDVKWGLQTLEAIADL